MKVSDETIIEYWDRVQSMRKVAEALGVSMERVAKLVGVEL